MVIVAALSEAVVAEALPAPDDVQKAHATAAEASSTSIGTDARRRVRRTVTGSR